jgi:CRP-like cAMP-binding protein
MRHSSEPNGVCRSAPSALEAICPVNEYAGDGMTVTRGTALFHENAPIRTLYFLTEGVVKLLAEVDGTSVFVGIRSGNCLLDAAAAIRGRRHQTTAVSLTQCHVRPISLTELSRARHTSQAVNVWLLEALSAELWDRTETSAAIMCRRKSASKLERIVVELFRAAGMSRPDGSWKLRLDITVTELSELTGLSRERTSKILGSWFRQGALMRPQGWLVAPPKSAIAAQLSAGSPARSTGQYG